MATSAQGKVSATGSNISATGQSAVGTASGALQSTQAATMKAFDNAKRSIQDFQKVIDDTKEKIKPVVKNTITGLKLISIALIGMADIMILQLVLIILNSSSVGLSLLLTQVYMTLFFVLPAIVIFKFPVPVGK